MANSGQVKWRFWIVTLSTFVLAGLTFSLGLWQLERASAKEKISLERRELAPISLNGQWLAEKTIYVDNRQMNARQGFFVVTPFVLADSTYVLVERGWIARDFTDRKKLQAVDTPAGLVAISVRRLQDPVPPAVIAHNAASEYPIVQYVSLGSVQAALQNLNYQGYVQQVGPASEGLLRNWYEPASRVAKHYGYAVQWFALCILLIGLYVWYQWIKK